MAVERVFQYDNHNPACSIEHTIKGPCLAWDDDTGAFVSLGYQDTRNQPTLTIRQPGRPS